MRRTRLALAVGVLLTMALVGVFGSRATLAQGQPPLDKAAVERIIREYLLDNPEVILEAVERLRAREQAAQAVAAQAALAANRAELTRSPRDPVTGNPQGTVTIVEFFDYQCGYCKQVHPSIKELVQTDNAIRLVHKEFPILGEASVVAARAALGAKAQGKYEAMHDALMEARGPLDEERIMRLARSVGVDVDRLRRDMQSPEVEAVISANLELAEKLGVRGTPAFVIGDTLIPGAVNLSALRQLVEQAKRS